MKSESVRFIVTVFIQLSAGAFGSSGWTVASRFPRAGDLVTRVSVVNDAILYFDSRGRVSEENALVRFGWRNKRCVCWIDLLVKRDPRFESMDLQIFQIDVALQVQCIQIFDPDRRVELIDLAEFFAGRRVVKFNAGHRHGPWRNVRKLANLGADAVVRESPFDLVRDITIDVAEAVKKERQHNQHNATAATSNPARIA